MRAHVRLPSLVLLGALAISGVACGSASIKPGGGAGAPGKAGAGGAGGGSAVTGAGGATGGAGAGGAGAVTGAGGGGGGAAIPACVLDSTQIDNCTLQ